MGDFDEVEIIELLVSVGDRVEREDSLITVETDKASMEIPSSDAGVVTSINVSIGDMIAKGGLILVLETEAESAPQAPASQPQAFGHRSKKACETSTLASSSSGASKTK